MNLLCKTTPLIVILREQIVILTTVSTFLREHLFLSSLNRIFA